MCETPNDLEMFMKTCEKITQYYGLTMNVKKMCIMALQQFEEDHNRIIIKNIAVNHYSTDINIRSQTIEKVDSFVHLGCIVKREQRSDKELDTCLRKAATAFNMLRHVIWCRKSAPVTSKLRIYRACVLLVLSTEKSIKI